MRKNHDFSSAVRNPYAKRLRRQLTIRLDEETIGYFQELSREMSLPYQTLMNMYLRDCAETQRRPKSIVGRMQAGAGAVLVSLLLYLVVGGCDRLYQIKGTVQVVPSAVRKAQLPAVLCTGPGGPLETSFVNGHPTRRRDKNDDYSGTATIFCSEPQADSTFPLDEAIIQGPLPRAAHVYAWLAPMPAAQSLCGEANEPVVRVDEAVLYRLKLATQAATHRADLSWPCGPKPSPAEPMSFVVTFDPKCKTWEETNRGWVERRTIRLE